MTTYTSQPDGTDGIDTSLQSAQATTNYATQQYFLITNGSQYGAGWALGLLKFDLSKGTNPPPAFASVISATLYLTLYDDSSNNALTMSLYRVKRAWVEAKATYNIYSTGNNWGTAGCQHADDRESDAIGSINLSATEANGEKSITLDPAKVQEWVNGLFDNNGVLLMIPNTGGTDGYGFRTSDYGTAGNRPKLVIEYVLGGQTIIWTTGN